MHPKGPNQQPAGGNIAIGDIYHVVFKRKWLILIFSILGLAGAAAMWFLHPPGYVSEAKLLILYVQNAKPLSPTQDGQISTGDTSGVGVLETEASILTSMDIAAAAAEAVGIDKILGKGVEPDRDRAALTIHKSLTVDVPKRGNALFITYEHPNPYIVQPVLSNIIKNYYIKHLESHRNVRFVDEFLTRQVDELRSSLSQTEEEIRKIKEKVGPIPLEDARKLYGERYAKIRDELDSAEAELNERLEAVKVFEKSSVSLASSDTKAFTNQVTEPKVKASAEAIGDYKRILTRLDAAYKQQENLLSQFTEESSMVKANKGLIASLEAQKTAMEHVHPGIQEQEAAVASATAPDRRESKGTDLTVENARVASLRARVKTLTEQFARVKAEESALDEIEGSYTALMRKRQLQETQYIYYSRSLDQANADSQVGASRQSNISEIQAPSVPVRDSKKLKKLVMAIAGAGVGGGFGLAFLLELVLAQTVRKPDEVESRLNVPVFLTIPEISGLRKAKPMLALPNVNRSALPAPKNGESNGNSLLPTAPNDAPELGVLGDLAPWEQNHSLHGYSEGLRDRLVTYFEMKGFKHKPKLVALTSCSRGAGVTSLAAGLAASLSETGEGNVLLVDLTGRGSAHPFYRGKPVCALAEVLEGENIGEKRSEARVNDNLYMVHGGHTDDRLTKVVPQRLAHLLPKLQQTDYDYIIFDMPPITQTSVTPRLAGFMDMMFVVVEAEKTNREWLKRAAGLLKQSNTNFAAVFNKRRDYTPRWLHQEF